MRQRPQSGLVKAWWECFVASNAVSTVGGRLSPQDAAVWSTLSALLGVAAAVLAARVIQRVNDRQLATAPDAVVAQEVSR